MKSRLLKLFSLLTLCACLLGCDLAAPLMFNGEITSVQATAYADSVDIRWTGRYLSRTTVYVDVYPDGDTQKASWFSTSGIYSGMNIGGLGTKKSYVFCVYILDNDRNVKSEKSCIATTGIKEYEYNSSTKKNSVIQVTPTEGEIKITGVKNKKVTFANVNYSNSSVISAQNARCLDLSVNPNPSNDVHYSVISDSPKLVSYNSVDFNTSSNSIIRNFVEPELNSAYFNRIYRAASDPNPQGTFKKDAPAIDQTRYIYVDQGNVNALGEHRQELMTLKAIRTDPDSNAVKCLVWINEKNLSETSSANKVNQKVIDDIANRFIKNYQLEEEIFGSTCDSIIYKDYLRSESSNPDLFPTSTYINIVLTDIGKDYKKASAEQCGIVGYFWSKDYYVDCTGSNIGKYFYIDIPFCNYNEADKTDLYKGNENKVSETVISTLFHEYQHMINFNKKSIEKRKNPSTWYNEMLSMLCEDLMQGPDALNLKEKVQDSRIPNFNAYYVLSGITQYLNNNSWISYGTAYSFGSWLVRNYGGAGLVKEMMKNDYVDEESVVAAVNTVNKKSYTWNQLMEQYVIACAIKTPISDQTTTHNIKPTGTDSIISKGNKKGQIDNGINLWAQKYGYGFSENDEAKFGPYLLLKDKVVDIQPHGFVFHDTEKPEDDSEITLKFTSSMNSNEKLYIFIQDSYSQFTADTTPEK